MRKQLADIGMDEWFADSIAKIKYLFPKAHGVLYVKYAAMLMWYKVHYPKEFEKCMKYSVPCPNLDRGCFLWVKKCCIAIQTLI
ncbi:MAG: hypothetical protein IJX54_05220 [Oscillospiraceae bacterium]|nr:hypothetical protein [Oscillospiraceae bacterium]